MSPLKCSCAWWLNIYNPNLWPTAPQLTLQFIWKWECKKNKSKTIINLLKVKLRISLQSLYSSNSHSSKLSRKKFKDQDITSAKANEKLSLQDHWAKSIIYKISFFLKMLILMIVALFSKRKTEKMCYRKIRMVFCNRQINGYLMNISIAVAIAAISRKTNRWERYWHSWSLIQKRWHISSKDWWETPFLNRMSLVHNLCIYKYRS